MIQPPKKSGPAIVANFGYNEATETPLIEKAAIQN